MIVGIVGSRRRTRHEDYILLYNEFELLCCEAEPPTKVISGGCEIGADSWAEDIAKRFNIPFDDKPYKPDLKTIPKGSPKWMYTNKYYERNDKLAKDADILLATVAEDRTGGTENTIKSFKKHHPKGRIIIV